MQLCSQILWKLDSILGGQCCTGSQRPVQIIKQSFIQEKLEDASRQS